MGVGIGGSPKLSADLEGKGGGPGGRTSGAKRLRAIDRSDGLSDSAALVSLTNNISSHSSARIPGKLSPHQQSAQPCIL